MTHHPKLKLQRKNGKCLATRMRTQTKTLDTSELGDGIVGTIGIGVVIWLVMRLIFNSVVATSVALTIGTVLLSSVLLSAWMVSETIETSGSLPFWVQSDRSNWSTLDVHNLLEEALAHPSYNLDAETIIEAGIAGINNSVDKDGEVRISLVLDESLNKLKGRMREHKDVKNTTAEDITRNFLEGYK